MSARGSSDRGGHRSLSAETPVAFAEIRIYMDHELKIPNLISEECDGFIDCSFAIRNLKSDEQFYYFDLISLHNSKTVGFSVKMVNAIGPGFDADMNLIKENVCYQGVQFMSLGEISDRLINSLIALYGLEQDSFKMVSCETFTAIALQQCDTDLKVNSVRLKLFGKDGEPFVEDDYYETFFHVDLMNGKAEWNEKDSDYRNPLIKALATTESI